jgi:hypothetical protein
MNISRRHALKSLVLGSGVVLSASSVFGVLNSAYAASAKGEYALSFLNAAQAKSLELMTHVIIPKSDDLPGAEDVPIVSFIDALYTQLMSKEQQDKFLAGLGFAQASFAERHGGSFAMADASKREAFVKSVYELPDTQARAMIRLAEQNEAPQGQEALYHLYYFLFNLRALTLEGYYQSELVGEKVLAYLPIPGRFEAETTIDENTRAWSI